ncbi:histidinol phosphate phosphatase HisJ family [Desulforamulus reducens MI-1]|uniref:Histidinol-phosphatase n=1 Tax=Desulforamulus reducens (strain ATCC BAA-1160 / DSM 100696 / MI-1) TaxID=349161 RepID=A4J7N4_DESRM|nr:histidinol-phosphatase [Desulforamulus reducens]ABO51087.1 histidinol phosphate phosphatase HisJ family [Desulforamulus reducens MI-1]
MLTDYHIHVERGPYTVDWLRQFYEQAQQVGIKDWGISEHAYRFIETKHIFWNNWVEPRQTEKMDDYQNMIFRARAEGIKVKFGIEIDFFPGKEKEIKEFIDRYPFDYVIGSVHWIDQWGIDLSEMKEEWERRRVEDVWLAYFDRIESLIESNLFDIAAHLDLAKIFSYIPTNQEFLQEQYNRIARVLAKRGTCIEISTAGLRKPVGEIYPHPLLLETCFGQGVPIVINSDAHCPEDVGADYERALDLARKIGYKKIQTFTNRKAESHLLG